MQKSFVATVGEKTEKMTLERALRGVTESMEANGEIWIAIDLINKSEDPAYQKQIVIGVINHICANLEGLRGWETKSQDAHEFLEKVKEQASKEVQSKTAGKFTFPIKNKEEKMKFWEIVYLSKAAHGLWMHLNEFKASDCADSSYLPFPLVLKHAEELGVADIFENTLWEDQSSLSLVY